MNTNDRIEKEARPLVLWLAVLVIVLLGAASLRPAVGTQVAAVGTPNYLPIIVHQPTPTPFPTPTITPSPTAPAPPQWVQDVALPGAQCPNSVGVNEQTGYVYVPNTHSSNVSIVRNGVLMGHAFTSSSPTYVGSVPNSPYTYVTNLTNMGANANQIAYFNGPNLEAMLPKYYEPVDVIYNVVNGLTYVSDLDSAIRVFDGATKVADIIIPNGGWLLTLAVDEATGYVYTAGWEKGMVHVINGLEVIESFPAGWGTIRIVIDQQRGYIYLAHSEPNGARPQNITIFHRDDRTLTAHYTSASSQWVAVDRDGFAYFPNFESNTVTVVQGRNLVANVVVGERPRIVASNETTGYTMVAVEGDGSAAVFKAGVYLGSLPAGNRPWFVATSEKTGEFFVANRTSFITCDDVERCQEICLEPSVSIYK